MAADIQPFGTAAGLSYYWVRETSYVGPRAAAATLKLVAIDDLGQVTDTGIRADDKPHAPTEEQAKVTHLAVGISAANADLERRERDHPAQTTEGGRTVPIPDRATERFYEDDD